MTPLRQRLRPSNWSMAGKLSALLLLVALLPMLSAAYYSLSGSLQRVRDTEQRNLQQLAASLAGRLDQLIVDSQHFLVYLSISDSVIKLAEDHQPAHRQQVEAEMAQLVAANPDIELLMVLNREGVAIAASKPQFVGLAFHYRDYYKQAIRGQQYVSDVEVGAISKAPGVFFSAPIFDRQNRSSGVAMLKLRGEALISILESARSSNNRYAFMVNADGVLTYHPDPRLLYRSLMPLPAAAQQRIAHSKQFMLQRIDSLNMPELQQAMVGARSAGSVNYRSPITGQMEIAGFSPASHRWVVGVNEPHEVFAAPLRELFNHVVLSLVVIAALVLGLSLLITRLALRPVRSLARAAQAMRAGDYEQAQAKPYWQDELGQLALTFNDMVRGVRERERERDIFGRVVSPEVREKLLAGEVQLGGESLKVTVLFSDIRGFSTISERMTPEQVVQFLNEYLSAMTEVVQGHGGYVNNFIGDAIVVVFGAPVARQGCAKAAILAALDMRDRLALLNQERLARGEEALDNGIGISTGEVVAGQVGSMERFLYTVIGDAVNVAARLEAMTKDFPGHPILLNDATYQEIAGEPAFHITGLGQHKVKGREEAVEMYGVARAK